MASDAVTAAPPADQAPLAGQPSHAGQAPLAEQQRDLARLRILRATQTVLADRGLAATIDDVAAAAGVNRRTVFRHFATRDALFAAAIREGVRRYTAQAPAPPASGDLRDWLAGLLLVVHRLNAQNGRIYWELAALDPAGLSGELASAAAERRESRVLLSDAVTTRLWQARGGQGDPPRWLADTVAVHLSGFTTRSLTGDFGRTPDEVAQVSAQTIEAALTAALATAQQC